MSCLYVNVKLINKPLQVNASIICSAGSNYYPLLVEEGYLLVDDNKGSQTILLVKKR